MASQQTQAHKDAGLQQNNDMHLKLLIQFINESLQSDQQTLPAHVFDRSRKFGPKDMDRLTPEQFKRIVSLIFQGKGPKDLDDALCSGTGQQRTKHMVPFGNFQVGFSSAVYDAQQKMFYQALRKLFPHDDDTLMPIVIFNPAGDPVRTKKVLKYLTNLMLFVDRIEFNFEVIQDELYQSGKEYESLVSRLDELKLEINTRACKLDDWKQEVPLLQQKSTDLSAEAYTADEAVATLDTEVQELEKIFSQMQERNRSISQKNESLKVEIGAKESQLVTNGDALVQEFQEKSKEVQEINNLRERFGEELKAIQEQQAFYENINKRVSVVIQSFKDIVHQMNEAAYGKRELKILEGEHQETMEALRVIKRKVDLLRAQDKISTAEGSSHSLEKIATLKDIQNQLKTWIKKHEQITKDCKEIIQSARGTSEILASKKHLAFKLKEKIAADENYIEALAEDEQEGFAQRICEMRDHLLEELSYLLNENGASAHDCKGL